MGACASGEASALRSPFRFRPVPSVRAALICSCPWEVPSPPWLPVCHRSARPPTLPVRGTAQQPQELLWEEGMTSGALPLLTPWMQQSGHPAAWPQELTACVRIPRGLTPKPPDEALDPQTIFPH